MTDLPELWKQTLTDPRLLEGGDPGATYKPATSTTVRAAHETLPTASLAGMGAAGGAAPAQVAVPRFDLLAEIGRGGMGVVYRARQASLGREVAVKRMKAGHGDAALLEAFVAEARVTGYLDHPNIVPVHELAASGGGEIFLTMKLIGGLAWLDLLHPKSDAHRAAASKLDREGHLAILIAVCNAVAFAHSRGVVHCDLKPHNVMVGEFGEVLLMDWGLAVDIGTTSTPARPRTSIENPAGTPSYMPPELAEGRGRDIGPWTDTYLLGAILHEIVAGRPPHRGATLLAIVEAAVRSAPPAFDGGVPEELAAVCRKALSPDPAQRYRDVTSLRDALQGYLHHRQSVLIAERAQTAFDSAAAAPTAAGRYARLEESVSRFRDAAELWEGNEKAREGARLASLAYAEAALGAGDLELAAAKLAGLDAPALRQRIESARSSRDARERTRRMMKAGLGLAAAALVVVGAVAYLLVSAERDRAVASEQAAVTAKEAEAAQRQLAERARTEEARQREEADRQRTEAVSQRRSAEVRLAESVVAQGDALLIAGRVEAAHERFREGYAALSRLGENVFGARVAMWEALRQSPPALAVATYDGGEVRCLDFAPDARSFAAGTRDGRVLRFESATAAPVGAWAAHSGEVKQVLHSPDGRWIATCGDKVARLWSAEGKPVRDFAGHGAEVKGLAWSPDGARLLTGGDDRKAVLWDAAAGTKIAEITDHTGGVGVVGFSPDGRRIFTSSDRRIRIRGTDGRFERELSSDLRDVTHAGFTEGGRLLWTGCNGAHAVELWEVETGRQVEYHRGLPSYAALAVREDGSAWLGLTNLEAYDAALYSLRDHAPLLRVGHRGLVGAALAVSRDGALGLVGGSNRTIWLYSLQPSAASREWASSACSSHVHEFTADGRAALATGEVTRLIDAHTGRPLRSFLAPEAAALGAVMAPDGARFWTVHNDGAVTEWSVETGLAEARWMVAAAGAPQSIVLSPDGRTLVTGGPDGAVKSWEAATRKPLRSWKGHEGGVKGLAMSPEGRRVASGGMDKRVAIWELAGESAEPALVLEGVTRTIGRLEFSPDGSVVAGGSGRADMTLAGHSTIATLWDARTGAKRRDLQSTRVGMWLEDLRFSPDGRILVTSELSAPVRLWNTATGQELREIVEPEISGLAMARDGSRAAGGTGRLHGLDFALVDEMLELESKVGAAREALRTSAQDGAALVVVGRWLAMNGRHEWAVELLERARAAGAEVPDLVVGRAWWARGRLDEAAPAFERALRKGEAPEAYLRLCLTAVRRGGGPSEAHAAALAWSPEALWERVKARIEARDGPGVTKELRRGVTLLATLLRADPDNREALAALVSVSRRAASMFAENKQVPVAAAMAEVALKAVEEVARERPADFAVLDAVGGLRMQLGGLRERQEQWREAFEAYRGAEEAYLPRVAAAAQDLEAAAKLASAYEATSSLIRPEQAVERLMKAKVEREKVLAVRSNDLTARSALGGVHRRLVQVRMQQKETEAAKTHARDWRAVAEEGRKLAPKDPDARWGAAQAAMFQSWISVDLQDWPAAHLSYGDALPLLEGLEADGVLKNYGQGPAMLGEARENVVKTAAMHIQSLIQAGKMDEAAAAAARYAETWPNEPDMVSARGMVAAARRDYDLAVRVYDEALKKWPDNTGLLYNAACAASLRSATRKDAERAADVARAVELLGRAVKAGYANADHVEKDGDMDPIRGEEGYKAAIAEMRKRK